MINSYLNFCRYKRALSPITVGNYEHVLQIFCKFLKTKNLQLLEIKEENILDFIDFCMKTNVKPSSINIYVGIISRFFQWGIRFHYGIFTENPAAEIPKLKVRKDLPRCISEKQLSEILLSLRENSWKQQRDKLIIMLAYHTGMRRRELISLVKIDVHLEEKTIRVLGKGGKVRIVPVSNQLSELFEKYFQTCAKLKISSPWVFSNSEGQQIDYYKIAKIVKRILKKFVPEELAHCHILRHSFATTCLNKGVSIENIAALMGHASIETTMRYLSISSERINAQMRGVF